MNQLSTKEKILATSLSLFNQSGVESITTRHIARELGMSQGNLHYHYPNKNEILNALFENFMNELKAAERYDGKSFLPETMYESMKKNFEIMHTYRLFFQQNETIWRRIPTIKTALISLFETKKKAFIELISMYKQEDKFRKDISPTQIDFLAEQFIYIIQTWLTQKSYQKEEKSAHDYSSFLFRTWLPYLNEEEMKNWEILLDK